MAKSTNKQPILERLKILSEAANAKGRSRGTRKKHPNENIFKKKK